MLPVRPDAHSELPDSERDQWPVSGSSPSGPLLEEQAYKTSVSPLAGTQSHPARPDAPQPRFMDASAAVQHPQPFPAQRD